MIQPKFITAIGTPLTEEDDLHVMGLEQQLTDQYEAGIGSLLAGGTMGMMQMLSDQTWRDLTSKSIEFGQGRFELFIGAGDTSFARTAERIEWLNERDGIAGVVVLVPYFLPFSQAELVTYFSSLARLSRHPLYLYDLPLVTHLPVEMDTLHQLTEQPNIAGIKHSGPINDMRRIIDELSDKWRVMVSQVQMVDTLLHGGVLEHLDGMFVLAPEWVVALGKAAQAGRWAEAAKWQRKITMLRQEMFDNQFAPSFTAVMNGRGIAGRFAPRPYSDLDEGQREKLFAQKTVAELCGQ